MTSAVYDLAIIGGGPAGLTALQVAATHGASVALIDDADRLGGHYYKELPPNTDYLLPRRTSAKEREFHHIQEMIAQSGARVYAGARVWGIFDESGATCDGKTAGEPVFSLYFDGSPAGSGTIQSRSLILAPGVYDRPLPFPGWDLPGVITPGAVQMMLEKQGLLPGQRVLVAGSGPLQMVVAAALLRHGAQVVAILETAGAFDGLDGLPPALGGLWSRVGEGASSMSAILSRRVPFLFRHAVFQALGTPETGVQGVVFGKIDAQGRPIRGTEREVQVDAICVAYGFLPSITITLHLGCAHHYDDTLSAFVPDFDEQMRTSVPGVYVAGDVTGIGGKPLAELQGETAAYAALGQVGKLPLGQIRQEIARLTPAIRREQRFARFLWQRYRILPGLLELANDDTILCHCEGVRMGAFRQSLQESASLYGAKLRTRIGMGNCQGRYCLPTAALYLSASGLTPSAGLDLPSIRPPIFPVRFHDVASLDSPESS